jgi:hypothetical protein
MQATTKKRAENEKINLSHVQKMSHVQWLLACISPTSAADAATPVTECCHYSALYHISCSTGTCLILNMIYMPHKMFNFCFM